MAGLQIVHMLKKPVRPQLNLGGIVFSALNNLATIGGIILGHPIYSSVPNRRVGQNKRAGGKILKKH